MVAAVQGIRGLPKCPHQMVLKECHYARNIFIKLASFRRRRRSVAKDQREIQRKLRIRRYAEEISHVAKAWRDELLQACIAYPAGNGRHARSGFDDL